VKRAVIRYYIVSGGGNIMFVCVITIGDVSLLGFWFGDGWIYLPFSARVIVHVVGETIFGTHLPFACFVCFFMFCFIVMLHAGSSV
jgi:hypothetical protein